jgi:SpoVK/Ycf46/Vps4 family AAA+-type ATPase
VFIDEVEEIAAQRSGEPPSPLQGVTNELLKIIPAFREQPGRLLVCATNFIRALDSAFLRHGRFDYVIPIGLPDEAARQAIWQRYVPEQVAAAVDVALLVERSAGFSPADIEFAARSASQRAFEAAVRNGATGDDRDASAHGAAPRPAGPSTADYLDAIAGTRTTVSTETAGAFLEDIERLARV